MIDTQVHTIIKDTPKAPVGCHTHRHASRELITKHDHLIHQHISHHILTISHHNMPYKNKLDALYFVVGSLRGFYGQLARTVLTYANHNGDYQVCYFNLLQGPALVKFDSTKVR